MKVLLIDIDSHLPNLALMQISAYHKGEKDNVNLIAFKEEHLRKSTVPFDMLSYDPDIIYISCIFSRNKSFSRSLRRRLGKHFNYPNDRVLIGGSGVNYEWLPEHMRLLKPDYGLYNNLVCQKCGKKTDYCRCFKNMSPGNIFYSMGFTTRGCIRKCDFCIVPEKEGKLERWQPVWDFVDDQFDKIYLMDNNLFADKEWFIENSDYIVRKGLQLSADGMDIRIIDKEIAKRLKMIKWYKKLRFAFDNMVDEKAVRYGIEILKDAKINIRGDVQFYVLVGYNTTEEEDKYRCRLLKELGTTPYVMRYVHNEWTNKIARWANYKRAFWSCDIDEYDQKIARDLRKERLRNLE